jgi:hypothetical protein
LDDRQPERFRFVDAGPGIALERNDGNLRGGLLRNTMSAGSMKALKGIGLAALVAVCGFLVYRNLIAPAGETFSAREPATAAGDSENSGVREAAPRAAEGPSGRREKAMDQRELAALDPTLRLDLLERTAKIKYEGGTRNIFQYYTPPPPKPVANGIVPVGPPAPATPVVPPPPTAPLKFYGMATPRGSSQKKAFLSDGDEIFIGMEGDVIDKHYKITRIGINVLEWEDTQNHQRGQLPLIQE